MDSRTCICLMYQCFLMYAWYVNQYRTCAPNMRDCHFVALGEEEQQFTHQTLKISILQVVTEWLLWHLILGDKAIITHYYYTMNE